MTEAKVDRTTAERIAMMIREGMPIEEIADIENIPPRLVAVLEHSIALREGEGTKLERLMDLLKENTGITLLRLDLKCQVQPRFFCPPENRAVDSSPKSQFGLEVAKKSGRHASVTTLIDPTDFQLCAITVKTHVGLDSRSGASASSPYFA